MLLEERTPKMEYKEGDGVVFWPAPLMADTPPCIDDRVGTA
jgi:hypothetical protein